MSRVPGPVRGAPAGWPGTGGSVDPGRGGVAEGLAGVARGTVADRPRYPSRGGGSVPGGPGEQRLYGGAVRILGNVLPWSTVVFVALAAVDSHLGNMITVPWPLLAADAVLGAVLVTADRKSVV